MADEEITRRRGLTFEQAEGLAPLPSQLERTEVSAELRAVLWNYIHEEISKSAEVGTFGSFLKDPWRHLLKQVHVYCHHLPADEFSTDLKHVVPRLKRVFAGGSYADIYGWLQFVLQLRQSQAFADKIESLLRHCRSAYRVVDKQILCPIASDAEAATVKKAFADLSAAGLAGAREHLKAASAALSAGDFSGSVRESIHSVESVVRVLEPAGDFSGALARLEQKANIHPAMKRGFGALYGFTSDEQGIRHPLLEKDAPAVDESDAMFMIGACASFVTYLIAKARAVGLLKT